MPRSPTRLSRGRVETSIGPVIVNLMETDSPTLGTALVLVLQVCHPSALPKLEFPPERRRPAYTLRLVWQGAEVCASTIRALQAALDDRALQLEDPDG